MTTSSLRTILLVEDDSLLRDAFRLLLEDVGYRVREAGTAAEALTAAAEVTPSLVLLDLGLPDAPGLDVARGLRAAPATRETPIVALTGRVGAEEKRLCLEAGCNYYLAKPVEPRQLLRRISEVLG
ncbi:MAG: response regulator [Gemmatimonadetes bacterium]|nr:response regulator [Gemmatimonadota bacterium]